jgi:hypothetical protein
MLYIQKLLVTGLVVTFSHQKMKMLLPGQRQAVPEYVTFALYETSIRANVPV